MSEVYGLWFRMYSDWAFNRKVQRLSEADQRRHAMLMCLHKVGKYDGATDDDLAFELRISADDIAQTVTRLKAAGLIDPDGQLHDWDDRQFVSDTSTSRVRRWRNKQHSSNADETLQKRCSNGDATPSETESESETESDAESDARVIPADPGQQDNDGAVAAAAMLAKYRLALDPGFRASGVADRWALSLAQLHAHGGRPYSEIADVMRWLFESNDWWSSRILNAGDFARHYDRIRSQWQASQQEPAAKAPGADPQQLRPVYENLDFELAEGGIDAARQWITTQPEKLRGKLTKRLEAKAS